MFEIKCSYEMRLGGGVQEAWNIPHLKEIREAPTQKDFDLCKKKFVGIFIGRKLDIQMFQLSQQSC